MSSSAPKITLAGVTIKLLCIGDSGVGKSALIARHVDGTFDSKFMSTVGIDFRDKLITLLGEEVKVRIWDTAGQERFRTITASFFRDAQGVLLVFDVTKRDTFENVQSWVSQLHTYTDVSVIKTLVGNKIDMDSRAVPREEAEALARKFGMPYYETSALLGTNVSAVFDSTAERVVAAVHAETLKIRGVAPGRLECNEPRRNCQC